MRPIAYKLQLLIAVIMVGCVVLLSPVILSAQQEPAITKAGLLKALGRKVLSSRTLIYQVQQYGVAFQSTPSDEQEIRRLGKYLGHPGLDDLVAAVRANYRAKTKEGQGIKQEMVNSPGGIQAGGSVTINQGLQPRRLTEEQETLFVKILRDNPKGNVNIACLENGGAEPCDFARQLARLLASQSAGWTVSNFSPMIGFGDPTKVIPELYLEAQSDKPPKFAFALKEALKAVGHEPICFVKPDNAPDFLQLTVSARHP